MRVGFAAITGYYRCEVSVRFYVTRMPRVEVVFSLFEVRVPRPALSGCPDLLRVFSLSVVQESVALSGRRDLLQGRLEAAEQFEKYLRKYCKDVHSVDEVKEAIGDPSQDDGLIEGVLSC